MVGRVLRGNDVVEREGRKYRLVGFEKFTPTQIKILQEACDKNHPNTFPIVETSSGAIVVGQSDTSAER